MYKYVCSISLLYGVEYSLASTFTSTYFKNLKYHRRIHQGLTWVLAVWEQTIHIWNVE